MLLLNAQHVRLFTLLSCFLITGGHLAASNVSDTLPCKHHLAKNVKWPGLSISIHLPCDWVVNTNYKPEILAVITGALQKGSVVVGTLSFIPSEIVLEEEAIDFLLSDGELRAATRHSGTYLESRRLTIDGNKTGEVQVKAQNEVNGVTLYSYKVYNYIYSPRGTVLLHFSVQSTSEKRAVTEFYRRLEWLRLIALQTAICWP